MDGGTLERSWSRFWNGLWGNLNPVPEGVRALLGSRVFWYALLLALGAGLGRTAIGGFGAALGMILASAVWVALMPNGFLEPAVALVTILSLRWGLTRVSSGGWARRFRGTKVCPECAEEVRAAANVCRYCHHRFAT
jgi:Uncharacterised protein family UPF0547